MDELKGEKPQVGCPLNFIYPNLHAPDAFCLMIAHPEKISAGIGIATCPCFDFEHYLLLVYRYAFEVASH